jgi:magnesium transporter
MVRTRAWRNGVLEAEDFDPALISDHLRDPGVVVWMDPQEPGEDDLKLVAEEFGLHPLTIEDATRPHQRPAVRRYAHHLFLVAYGLRLAPPGDPEGERLMLSEVDAFAGDRFLITVRKAPLWPIDDLLARWDSREEIARHGVGYLLYELLDAAVASAWSRTA